MSAGKVVGKISRSLVETSAAAGPWLVWHHLDGAPM